MGCLYLSCAVMLFACGEVAYRRPGIVLMRTGLSDAGDVGIRVDAAGADAAIVDARVDGRSREDATPLTAQCGDALETAQFALTNVVHSQTGAPALRCDLALLEAARAHSRDMCTRHFFSHTNPDGRNAAVRLQQLGFRGRVGENIGLGAATADTITAGWSASSGHYGVMVDTGFRRLGVGHVVCPNTSAGHLWTQDFSD